MSRKIFPEILYEMVDEEATDSIISWSSSGESFIVWNETEFCRDVLPRYSNLQLKSNTLSSFRNRLGVTGFGKVESAENRWEYDNPCFVRGKPELTTARKFVVRQSPEVLRVMEMRKKHLEDIIRKRNNNH